MLEQFCGVGVAAETAESTGHVPVHRQGMDRRNSKGGYWGISELMTALSVLFRISVIVFIAEGLTMLGLSLYGPKHLGIEAVVDSLALMIISSPAIYFWVIKPFIDARNQAEKLLREKSDELVGNVEKKISLVNLLHKISAIAYESLETRGALRRSLEEICAYLQWPVGHVYEVSPSDPDAMVSTDIWRLDNPQGQADFRKVTENIEFKKGIGLPGRILAEGRPVWIADISQDGNFPRHGKAKDFNPGAGFGVPVLVEGKVAMVLEFFMADPSAVDDELMSDAQEIGFHLGRMVERMRAEDALRASETRYQAIVESQSELICRYTPDGKRTFVNDAYCRFFGKGRDELIGASILSDIPDEDIERVKKHFSSLGSDMPGRQLEHSSVLSDGTVRLLQWNARAILGETGQVVEVQSAGRDITERKLAEDALKKSEESFSKAFHSNPASMAIASIDDGELFNVNESWLSTLGYSREEVIGRDVSKLRLWDDSGRRAAFIEKLKGGGSVRDFDATFVTRDGELRNMDLAGELIELEGERRLLVAFNDVTEKKQAEIALHQAKEASEHASRAKSEFFATMSHELRTPLNSIIGFSDMIFFERLGAVGNEKYLEYAKDINDAGGHLLRIINEILDISKIEAGDYSLDDRDLDVIDVVKTCLMLLSKRAKDGQVTISSDIAHGLPGLHADETKVKQILLNLISNAIKFTPQNGHVNVDVCCGRRGEILVRVKDTGCGIAPEDIPRIFNPFEQVENIMIRKHEGIGLGLPLSQRLIDMHGGSLEMESEIEKGTTVTVRFPPERTIH